MEFSEVYTVNVNREPKVCHQSFMQDLFREKIEITNPWGSRPLSALNDAPTMGVNSHP